MGENVEKWESAELTLLINVSSVLYSAAVLSGFVYFVVMNF